MADSPTDGIGTGGQGSLATVLIAGVERALEGLRGRLLEVMSRRSSVLSAAEMKAVEEEVSLACLGCADAVTGAVIVASHRDAAFVSGAIAPTRTTAGLRHVGLRQVSVRLLGGTEVAVTTPYVSPPTPGSHPGRRRGVGKRGKGGGGRYPVLRALGIYDGASPALASRVVQEVVAADSIDCARESLAARGIRLDRKVVRRLVQRVGDRALKDRQERVQRATAASVESAELAGKRIAIGVDGGRTKLRWSGKRGRRRRKSGYRGFHAEWREPKVFVVYELDERGRKRPSSLPIYDATLGDADAVFEILLAELVLRGARAASLIVILGDGAPWIWDRVPALVERLGVDPSHVVEILDYYHASEHLHETAELRRGWTDRQKSRWLANAKGLLRAGKVDALCAEILAIARGRSARTIADRTEYFERNADRMRYRQFRARKLPIGSGAVESAVRRIVNLRLKGNGIFWDPQMAEAVLHLRAALKAGRWDEAMRAAAIASPCRHAA